MKGARELSDDEVIMLAHSFSGKYAPRNRALFLLGCCTGARVSELLALNVGDVWQFGRVVDAVYFERRNTKGKKEGRSIPLVSDAQAAIIELIAWLEVFGFSTLKTAPLFPSQKGGRLKNPVPKRIFFPSAISENSRFWRKNRIEIHSYTDKKTHSSPTERLNFQFRLIRRGLLR